MRSGSSKQLFHYFVAALAGLIVVSSADAASARRKKDVPPPEPEVELSGKAAIAVVSIKDQRISVYDASGIALRARISSGQDGYETPVGVFSILQKNAEHYSNLYDDASMPFMQRITWSGVALHAGALPGYPASHGCVRLPYNFAQKIFPLTKLGMRVVISRDDIAPVDISNPLLLAPEPIEATAMAIPTAYNEDDNADASESLMQPDVGNWPARQKLLDTLRADAREKTAASEVATQHWQDLTGQLKSHKKELSLITKRDRIEKLVDKAKDRLAKAEKRLAAARTPRSQKSAQKEKNAAEKSLATIDAKANDVRAAAQQAEESLKQLKEDIAVAEKAKTMAAQESSNARRKTMPISVFVSLKSQKLYVRQGNEPVFDTKVAIAEPDRVIGTHIFTALDYANDGNEVRWNVVTISRRTAYEDDWDDRGQRKRKSNQSYAPPVTNASEAAAALERVSIPADVRARISKYVWPGSSLIISDEELSKETGPGTDFILVSSDEPSGALLKRKRETPPPSAYYDRDFYSDRYYYRPLNRYERRVPIRPKTLFDWW
ncbi:MAG: L,D-transpeptidase family protein [Hyphomicrobiaceae bacterium]